MGVDNCDRHTGRDDDDSHGRPGADVRVRHEANLDGAVAPNGDIMRSLPDASLIVADELRRAERSINAATRDTAQFLATSLEVAAAHGLSPAMSHSFVKATIGALSSLADSQGQMAMRAHPLIEKIGLQLGLTETNWGGGAPKPQSVMEEVQSAA